MPRSLKIGLAAALAAAFSLLAAGSALADFQLVKIKEVSGSTGHNRASYIELQMYSPGQTDLAGHEITIWDSSGVVGGMTSPVASFILTGPNPTNGQNQRTILIGDTNVANADFTLPIGMTAMDTWLDSDTFGNALSAGAICFEEIDCVSWGGSNFFAQSRIPDHAEPHPQALPTAFSLRRRVDLHGCLTALDASDDSNDNAVDFVQGNRQPTPNSSAPTDTVCPTARCSGLAATIIGTAAHNVIVGTGGRDVIAGLGGPDIIRGLAGNDVLCGGGGPDKLIGGGGRDKLLGQAGRDICKGGPKRDIARTCETKRTI